MRRLGKALVFLSLIYSSWGDSPISEVDNFQGLKDVAGYANDLHTGERFIKDVVMLVHDSTKCVADFQALGIDRFAHFDTDIILVTSDVKRVDEDFLNRFSIETESMPCPLLVYIPARSLTERPAFKTIDASNGRSTFSTLLQFFSRDVGVFNEHPFPIIVNYMWWDGEEKRFTRELNTNEESWHKTFRTTRLVARAVDDEEVILDSYQVKGHGVFVVANRTCIAKECGRDDALQKPPLTELDIQHTYQNEAYRLKNSKAQPKLLPKFTETGFAMSRVPDDAWDAIMMYWHSNQEAAATERWATSNSITNDRESPSYMVLLPEGGVLRPYIAEELRPILEGWIGGIALDMQAVYGIRVYTSGATLATHVDTKETHAVSLIINVDQEVEEDWPLLIYDHAGTAHNITMAPRDMVLYESAVCVHGRPTTFDGKFYANMFVHFRPKDTEKWLAYLPTERGGQGKVLESE